MLTPLLNRLEDWHQRGWLHLAAALLFEALVFCSLAFASLYSLELLLPTFVSARFPLMEMLVLLLFGLALYLWLENFLGLQPGMTSPPRLSVLSKVFIVCSSLWGILLFFISLAKFPMWSFPILLIIVGSALYRGWRARNA